jgi:hypothetical protein
MINADLGWLSFFARQTNEVIEWLNRAADERSNWMIFLNVDPVFDPLRAEPEFQRLVRRIGLAA